MQIESLGKHNCQNMGICIVLFSGGKGGQGGRGIYCEYTQSGGKVMINGDCEEDGQTSRAPQGDTGTKGKDGQGKLLIINN